jgi:hypothetical protein
MFTENYLNKLKKINTNNSSASSDLPLLVLSCVYLAVDAFPITRFVFNQFISWIIVGLFLVFLFTSKSSQILLLFKRKSVYLLSIGLFITSFHLFSIFFFEYGLNSEWNLYRWLRAIPFIFFGLVSASSNRNLYVTSLVLATSNTISTLTALNYSLAYHVQNGISSGRGFHGAQLDFDAAASGVRGWSGYQALVYVFILSIGFLLVSPKKPLLGRLTILACIISTSISILNSSFLTAVICLIISILIFVILSFDRKKFIFSLVISSLVIFGIYLIIQTIISFDLPGLSQVTDRLSNIWEGFNSGVGVEFDASGRERELLRQVSWDSFNSSPFIGIGAYLGEYNKVGGHSNIVDWLAQFGILGVVGPSTIIGYCIYSSFQISKSKLIYLRNLGKALLCFWLVFVVNAYMGYVFLEPSIDTYSFLAIGLTIRLSCPFYTDTLSEPISIEKSQLKNITK